MSRLYTKTGDAGQTGLLGGLRAPKTARRFAAIGALDELNAHLGLAVAELRAKRPNPVDRDVISELEAVQGDLFSLGAYLADPYAAAPSHGMGDRVQALERCIDRWQEATPALLSFILPGGTRSSAQLHVARAVCRRAERTTLQLHEEQPLHPVLPTYLNRLSDLLFAAARLVAHRAQAAETPWSGTV